MRKIDNNEKILFESFMDRMDCHMTLKESKAALNEMLDEERTDYGTFDDLIKSLNVTGSRVNIGYIQGYEASKVYPGNTQYALDVKSEIGKMDPASRIGKKMNGFIGSAEFNNPSGRAYGGLKSMATNPFAGVIKITNYETTWGSSSDLDDFYKRHFDAMKDARKSLGFGNPDSSYAADDWRRNPDFKGLGLDPEPGRPRLNPDGTPVKAPYSQELNKDISLYGDTDTYGAPRMSTDANGNQYQKRLLKLGLGNTDTQWSAYCIVDTKGEIDDVESSLAKLFFKVSLPKDIRASITAQMSQDEQNARNKIAALTSNFAASEKRFVLDNIAYITGEGMDKITGEKVPFRWVNKNIELDKFYVDPNEMQGIITKALKEAYKD